jgi:hypothetical protein
MVNSERRIRVSLLSIPCSLFSQRAREFARQVKETGVGSGPKAV